MKWIIKIAICAIVLVAALVLFVCIFRGYRQTANADAAATKAAGHSGTAEQPTSIQELKWNSSKKYLISCMGTHIRIPWGTIFQVVAVMPSSNRDYIEVVCAFSKETLRGANYSPKVGDPNNNYDFGLLILRIKNFQSIGGSYKDLDAFLKSVFKRHELPKDFILCIREEFRGQGSRVVWEILHGAEEGPLVMITDGSLLNLQRGIVVNNVDHDNALLDLPDIK